MSRYMGSKRTAARRELYEQIRSGNGPLDRVEKFCRENRCFSYEEFIAATMDSNPDLYEWATKSGQGVGGRIRGINARINIVRREFGMKSVRL